MVDECQEKQEFEASFILVSIAVKMLNFLHNVTRQQNLQLFLFTFFIYLMFWVSISLRFNFFEVH